MDYCVYGDIASWNHKKARFELKKQFPKTLQFFKDKFLQTAKGLEYCTLIFNKMISAQDEYRTQGYQAIKYPR